MVSIVIDALLVLTILPLLISVIMYARVPWHTTSLGKFFMSYHFSMLLIWVLVLVLRHDFGVDKKLLSNISLIIFAIVSILLWWGAFLMHKYTVRERKRIDNLEEERREG